MRELLGFWVEGIITKTDYRPKIKLREGNVFTGAYLFTGGGGRYMGTGYLPPPPDMGPGYLPPLPQTWDLGI